jgi:membrane-associated phospholipid phosphatase
MSSSERARLVLAAAFTLATSNARAEGPYELRHDAALDLAITLGGVGFIVATEAMKGSLAPDICRWCDRDEDGHDSLNALDRAGRSLRWESTRYAAGISDASAFLAAPATAYGSLALAASTDGGGRFFAHDALFVTEAVAMNGVLNQIVKFSVGRERPYAHYAGGIELQGTDRNLSFYSGHTSIAFSLATSSGTVAALRGYDAAPAVFAASLSVAFLTGYLRLAADKHYLTDVLAGALLGSAVGVVVPLVFHGRADVASAPALPSSPQPATVSFVW